MLRSVLSRWYAIFGLATVTCCCWVYYRVWVSGTELYTFMMWNLFLAWIPMWAATACMWFLGKGRPDESWRRAGGWLMAVIWLLFLPNGSYVVTDLIHFSYVRGVGLWPWSDLFMLLLFAWTGLLMCFCSIYLLQDYVRSRIGPLAGWAFSLSVLLMQAVGVYVGRELRWNSWWVLTDPKRMLSDLPVFLHMEPYRFIGMTAVFCSVGYIMIYSFMTQPRMIGMYRRG